MMPSLLCRTRRLSRSGKTAQVVVLSLAAVAVVGAVVFARPLLSMFSSSSDDEGPMTCVVERRDFLHEITERGNIESAQNKEVRCEVQSLNTAGTRIIKIVPEGAEVKKGQELIVLDSSALKNDEIRQQGVRDNAEAVRIEADNAVRTAEIALKEYRDGKYKQEEEKLQSELFVAEEDLRRAEEYLRYSKKLTAKGYITPLQLAADSFALEKAIKARDAARTNLEVLQKHTRAKMELQLESDIATAKAKLGAAESALKLEEQKLKLIQDQIAKCVIPAPEDGQVVYANQTDPRGGQEVIIEEGATVRERQVIIRLPDPKQMQVRAKINESKVALVAEGHPAAIRVQAYPEKEMHGAVKEVNKYPVPGGFWGASVKEYETVVRIDDPPVVLRPGLTAEVRIRVAYLPGVLQVPVQAVFEHGGRHYCVRRSNGRSEGLPVQVGASNDKYVVILDGVNEGDVLAMNAASFRDELDLPPLPPGQADGSGKGREVSPGEINGGAEPSEKRAETKKADSAAAQQMFQQLDKNGDGKLQEDELPERMRSRFAEIDVNGDKAVDQGEWAVASRRFQRNRGEGKGPPGDGSGGPPAGGPGGNGAGQGGGPGGGQGGAARPGGSGGGRP